MSNVRWNGVTISREAEIVTVMGGCEVHGKDFIIVLHAEKSWMTVSARDGVRRQYFDGDCTPVTARQVQGLVEIHDREGGMLSVLGVR